MEIIEINTFNFFLFKVVFFNSQLSCSCHFCQLGEKKETPYNNFICMLYI